MGDLHYSVFWVTYSFFSIICFVLFRPCHMACRILVPWPGIEPTPSAVKVWGPNHCTTRELPVFLHYSLPLVQFLPQQMSFVIFLLPLYSFYSLFTILSFSTDNFSLIPLVFSLSFLKSVSVKLKRSVSLFVLSGELSWSFNWEWFLSFILRNFLSQTYRREIIYCGLGGLFICGSITV